MHPDAHPVSTEDLCPCRRARFGDLHDCSIALLPMGGEEMLPLEHDESAEGDE